MADAKEIVEAAVRGAVDGQLRRDRRVRRAGIRRATTPPSPKPTKGPAGVQANFEKYMAAFSARPHHGERAGCGGRHGGDALEGPRDTRRPRSPASRPRARKSPSKGFTSRRSRTRQGRRGAHQVWDALGMLVQLGAVPAPATASPLPHPHSEELTAALSRARREGTAARGAAASFPEDGMSTFFAHAATCRAPSAADRWLRPSRKCNVPPRAPRRLPALPAAGRRGDLRLCPPSPGPRSRNRAASRSGSPSQRTESDMSSAWHWTCREETKNCVSIRDNRSTRGKAANR